MLSGAALVMAKPGGHKDPLYLLELARKHHVAALFFVPSLLSVFLETLELEDAPALTNVRHVFCAGEALTSAVCRRFHAGAKLPCATLHNLYGPTESDMTHWACPPAGSAAGRRSPSAS